MTMPGSPQLPGLKLLPTLEQLMHGHGITTFAQIQSLPPALPTPQLPSSSSPEAHSSPSPSPCHSVSPLLHSPPLPPPSAIVSASPPPHSAPASASRPQILLPVQRIPPEHDVSEVRYARFTERADLPRLTCEDFRFDKKDSRDLPEIITLTHLVQLFGGTPHNWLARGGPLHTLDLKLADLIIDTYSRLEKRRVRREKKENKNKTKSKTKRNTALSSYPVSLAASPEKLSFFEGLRFLWRAQRVMHKVFSAQSPFAKHPEFPDRWWLGSADALRPADRGGEGFNAWLNGYMLHKEVLSKLFDQRVKALEEAVLDGQEWYYGYFAQMGWIDLQELESLWVYPVERHSES